MADITNMLACLHLLNPQHHGIIGNLTKSLRLYRHFAYPEHAAGITVPAVNSRGDVDINDISVLQLTIIRNAVANNVIHRGADGFRKAAVTKWRGNSTGFNGHFMAN